MAKFAPLTISQEQVDALEKEHGDICVFRGTEKAPWLAVLRLPTFEEVQAFKALAADPVPSKSGMANLRLIQAICVFPPGGKPSAPGAEWKAQVDHWSLFPDGLSSKKAFRDFVGLEMDESEK